MKKPVIISLIAIVLLTLAVYLGLEQQAQYTPKQAGSTVQNFADKINLTNRIALIKGEVSIHLALDERNWVLEESGNYPITLNKLRALITNIGDSKKIESRSSDVEDYAEYGLHAGSKSSFIAFDKDNGELIKLTIGSRMNQLEGWYALIGDDPQVWVISSELAIDVQPRDWLEPGVIDLPSTLITRIEKNDFTLLNDQGTLIITKLKNNKSPDQPRLNQVGSALTDLTLLDASIEQPDLSGDAETIEYFSNNGLVVTITHGHTGDLKYWAKLTSSSDRSLVVTPATNGDVSADETDLQQKEDELFAKAKSMSESVNARLNNHWIQIPSVAGKAFGYSRNDLIKKP